MMRLASLAIFVAEITAIYFWQIQDIAAAGRLFLFWMWICTFFLLACALLVFGARCLLEKPIAIPRSSTIGRWWSTTTVILRTVALVVTGNQALAAFYLFAVLSSRFIVVICRVEEKPESA